MRPEMLALALKRGLNLAETAGYLAIREAGREIRIHPRHDVYLQNMISEFGYWHGAVAAEEREGVAVVDYSTARVHRLTRTGIEFEFPSLAESDESTEVYLGAMNLQPGDVVFDLGAYAGASTYFFSQAVGPAGFVASFEPDMINFACLERNVARHGLKNVKAFNQGVWRESTTLAFQTEGNMGSAATQLLDRFSDMRLVRVVTLEDAATLCGATRVAAIKMDIEGAEIPVLESAREFLQHHRPALVVEPHIVRGEKNLGRVCGILESYGYEVRLLSQGVEGFPLIGARYPGAMREA